MSLVVLQQMWACRLSGYAALLFLLGSQSLGPARRLGRVSAKTHLRWRRRLGIYAAFFASLHLLIAWRTFLGGWLLEPLRETTWTQLGLASWSVLLLLWLTSYPRLVRFLRIHSWVDLHKLVYPATALALLHALLAPWSNPKIHFGLLIFWIILIILRIPLLPPILKR